MQLPSLLPPDRIQVNCMPDFSSELRKNEFFESHPPKACCQKTTSKRVDSKRHPILRLLQSALAPKRLKLIPLELPPESI